MVPKVMVQNGETNEDCIKVLGGAMLGYKWDPRLDVIRIKFRVNISKR